MAQLTHMLQLLCRHYRVYYPVRQHLVQHMVSSIQRLGLTPNVRERGREGGREEREEGGRGGRGAAPRTDPQCEGEGEGEGGREGRRGEGREGGKEGGREGGREWVYVDCILSLSSYRLLLTRGSLQLTWPR